MTTTESEIDLKAGRRRVARSRGALSGVLLIILGAWAALVPFIGPYFDFGITPRPDDAWHWTSGRGLYELLPGGVAALAGLLLLLSASRLLTVTVAWFAALAGAWLVVAGSLAPVINVDIGGPADPTKEAKTAAQGLLYFFAIGAAIILVAALALGRLSVHSVRDVRAAERRAEAEAAEEQRLEREREAAEAARAENQRRYEDEQRRQAEHPVETDGGGQHDVVVAGDGRHEAGGATAADHAATGAPAQQSPYAPDGPRDTAGSTGYQGARTTGSDDGTPYGPPTQHGQASQNEQPTQHQPAVADRTGETREYPAAPQEYPPPTDGRSG